MLVAELRAVEEDVEAARATVHHAATAGLDFHHQPRPALRGERVRIASGATVVVRPIEPADRAELAADFQHLSALTRFRSTHEPTRSLSAAQLDELMGVDHVSHEVLIARDAATAEGVGLGRYVRDPADPTRAELACTVTDRWQRRGVGTALIERLAAIARAAGITHFVAYAVLGDRAAPRLLAHVADNVVEHRDGGFVELDGEPKPS
jgi:GNAT superfamily N-acetyltransferase